MKNILLLSLTLLVLFGCDKDKAQQAVKDATSKASQTVEETAIAAQFGKYIAAVNTRDLPALKQLCTDSGCAEYQAIMMCYYDAFAIENVDGVEAAKKYLADQAGKSDNSPARAKALGVMTEYFNAKGSLRTKEIAGLILVIGLEAKYPHHGGKIGYEVAKRMGLLDDKSPTSGLASGGK